MKLFDNEDGVLSVEVSHDSWMKIMEMVTRQEGLHRIHKHFGDDGVSFSTSLSHVEGDWKFQVTKFDSSENGKQFRLGDPKITKEFFDTVEDGMAYLEREKVLPAKKVTEEWLNQ
jgi:hypothetical protein